MMATCVSPPVLANHYNNLSKPTGIYTYGQWVNGGVWSTQDTRAMMAYVYI